MSQCFCTGECEHLGYCPNMNNIFTKIQAGWFCEYCQEIHSYNTRKCPKKHAENFAEWLESTENQPSTPEENLEEGDEIWYRIGDNSGINHDKVLEVRKNVIKVRDAESITQLSKWREIDNLDIIEIEKKDNDSD